MHSQKEYVSKIRKLEIAFKKSEEKNQRLKSALSISRSEGKYHRRRIKELTAGRDSWKAENKVKRSKIKGLEQKLLRREKAYGHQYSLFLVELCVLLRTVGNCSYRSVHKILQVLSTCSILKLSRCPSPNTIQNWVSKVGLYEVECLEKELVNEEVILIVDESIRIGKEKQLLILSTPYKKAKNGSLCYSDVKVLYFGGRGSWTGDLINEQIKELEEQIGFIPRGILSDEDSKLKKASRLQELLHLPDISHAIATCLKKVFNQNEDYQSFMKDLSSYKSKGVNQDLSYLLPPKQGSKARFMNVSNSLKWAEKMLTRFEELSGTEQEFFKNLPSHRVIIEELSSCISLAQAISLPLKINGLSKQELEDIEAYIEKNKEDVQHEKEGSLLMFIEKIEAYISHYQYFITKNNDCCVPINSDVIESLFGTYKNLASSDKLIGATVLNLEIGVRCMKTQDIKDKIKDALECILMSDLQKWKTKHSSDSQVVKRNKFFRKRKEIFQV